MSRTHEPAPALAAATSAPLSDRARHAARSSFAACVGASLALNLLAVGLFVAVVTAWHSGAAGGGRVVWIAATTIDRPAAIRSPDEEAALGTQRKAATERPQSMPRERRVMLAPPGPLSSAASTGEPIRFYSFGEVDRPAEPDSDWNLDPAALDALGVQALVFDIFIGRSGEVIECKIIEPQSLPDEARAALEGRLRQTVVQPALRHDVAVASVRRIEISIVAQGS